MKDYNNLSDENLVKIIREKDKEVFSEIIKRYEQKLVRYAFYLINDEIKSEDIVQQAFIKTYKNLWGFNTNKKFSSWIYRMVHNEAVNEIKKHKWELDINLFENFNFKKQEQIEDKIIKEELKTKLNYCLKNMDIKYKEPLTLYFLEEKSYIEIGDILKIPQGTVATRINRAKLNLKKLCKTQK